jgi:hypothetical protein
MMREQGSETPTGEEQESVEIGGQTLRAFMSLKALCRWIVFDSINFPGELVSALLLAMPSFTSPLQLLREIDELFAEIRSVGDAEKEGMLLKRLGH